MPPVSYDELIIPHYSITHMSYELPQETFSVCVKYKSRYNMPVRDKQSWMLYKTPYSLAKSARNLSNWPSAIPHLMEVVALITEA